MGKSRKMAKTAIPMKDLKQSEKKHRIMTQKLDSSKAVFKTNKPAPISNSIDALHKGKSKLRIIKKGIIKNSFC